MYVCVSLRIKVVNFGKPNNLEDYVHRAQQPRGLRPPHRCVPATTRTYRPSVYVCIYIDIDGLLSIRYRCR